MCVVRVPVIFVNDDRVRVHEEDRIVVVDVIGVSVVILGDGTNLEYARARRRHLYRL